MNNDSKKLLIWDFDGVIADTEEMWLQTRMDLLNSKYNLNWDIEKTNYHLGGMSDKTKIEVLKKLGISTDCDFWKRAIEMDMKKIVNGLPLTRDIEKVFELTDFSQCIATGGDRLKTAKKIEMVGIRKYFPAEKVFTADMVKYGKPEPDLFLFAAKSMGYNPKDCIVIEDSLAGITAAVRAGMTTIAFTKYLKYGKAYFIEQINKLGVKNSFANMNDLKTFLQKEYL